MNKIKYYIILATITLFTLNGCGNWLDVSPENQVTDEKLFDDYSGFRNALNGIYQELSQQGLYGRELSWGLISVLAQDYNADRLNKAYPEVATYNYDLADTKKMIDNLWIQMYNTIANCNKLIEEIQKKDGTFFPLGKVEKDLIEGEALALRAFIHFDLLRLFAPSPKVNATGTYLPYFTTYPSKYEPKQKTSDFLQLVIGDLSKAKDLVAHFDSTHVTETGLYSATWRYTPQSINLGRFFNSRGIRLNYIAIHGLLARVYMYAGDETNAEKEARFVLEHFVASEGGEDALRFASTSELTSGKGLHTKYKSEIMFALYDDKLTDLYDEFKTTNNTRFALKAWTDFFTEDGDDSRKNLGEYNYETGLYNLLKWQSFDTEVPDVTPNFNLIPVLRLSEMYYIISECRYNTSDATNAQIYLQKVRDAYQADNRTVDMNRYQKELTLEMKKEYLTEGQLFFFYKRLNIAIENGGETVNVGNKFVLPIPEKEDVF
ncbi:RagB/SusD family nutrient uptake outer membrane protein [Butyricimonas sp. Marseille-P3923]|uniref:RagB/SusD family nutrient uptake outer membrane protein n=1 Tax=Butyricimonas sp. Marseille-P3923 TaxID=1987504 RepID=UPI000C07536C|nr:RagB/SusD family nutrient uptake outer membrane protein [Butyricimonas sp. Marseille-P3923]